MLTRFLNSALGSPFWVDGVAEGRIAFTGMPGGGGFRLRKALKEWKREGVGVIVSALSDEEVVEGGLFKEREWAQRLGMDFRSLPIMEGSAPDSKGQFNALIGDLADYASTGGRILIHCREGIGRSGMIAACLLVELGWGCEDAIRTLSRARGFCVPQTVEQSKWVRLYQRRKIRVSAGSENLALAAPGREESSEALVEIPSGKWPPRRKASLAKHVSTILAEASDSREHSSDRDPDGHPPRDSKWGVERMTLGASSAESSATWGRESVQGGGDPSPRTPSRHRSRIHLKPKRTGDIARDEEAPFEQFLLMPRATPPIRDPFRRGPSVAPLPPSKP